MQLRTATPEEVAAWRDTFESDNPNCGGAESDTQDEYLSAIALQTPTRSHRLLHHARRLGPLRCAGRGQHLGPAAVRQHARPTALRPQLTRKPRRGLLT